MQQKAVLITCSPESVDGLDALNVYLGRGWRVEHIAPLGGAGAGGRDAPPTIHLAALVIMERAQDDGAALLEEAAEEVEEVIEEIVEENGAPVEIEGNDLTPPMP